MPIDTRSGYNPTTSTFHSKRPPIPLPPNNSLTITTFISSRPHFKTTALIDSTTDHRISYTALWRAVDSLSFSLFTSYGIKKGHVVLILSPNSMQFPIVCLSVMSLGALITTANPLNTVSELGKQLADSKPSLAFTTRELAPKLARFGVPVILLGSDGNTNTVDDVRVVSTFEELMKVENIGKVVKKERVDQNDAAALMYSSGTTGLSKGVILSHGNLIGKVATHYKRFQMGEDDSVVAGTAVFILPMFHIFGLTGIAGMYVCVFLFELDRMIDVSHNS